MSINQEPPQPVLAKSVPCESFIELSGSQTKDQRILQALTETVLVAQQNADIPFVKQAFELLESQTALFVKKRNSFNPDGRGVDITFWPDSDFFHVERQQSSFDRYIKLNINPDNFLAMKPEERMLSLVHEANHISDLLSNKDIFKDRQSRVESETRALYSEFNVYAQMSIKGYRHGGRDLILGLISQFPDSTPQQIVSYLGELHVDNPGQNSHQMFNMLMQRIKETPGVILKNAEDTGVEPVSPYGH